MHDIILTAGLVMSTAAGNAVAEYYAEHGELNSEDESLPYEIASTAFKSLRGDREMMDVLETVDQDFFRFRAVASFVQDAIRQFEPED